MKADIAIIGGGPGGYVAALRAAQLGARVALVEQNRLGGACLNSGCIPTKALLEVARTLDTVRRAGDRGIQVDGVRVDLEQVRRYRDRPVKTMTLGVRQLLAGAGVEVLAGRGVLRRPSRGVWTVVVHGAGGTEVAPVEARAVIVATGSRPAPLPLGSAAAGFWDSDGALALTEVPERLAIIGGGAVGVEFASIYRALGSQVTLIELLPRLLPREDVEVGEELARLLRRQGVRVVTGARVQGAEALPGGGFRLELESAGASPKPALSPVSSPLPPPAPPPASVEVAAVLAAVGRRPTTDGLGLEQAGLAREAQPPGWLAVNERMETAAPGLYAVGDVNGRSLLAHAASAQGIVAAEAILGLAPSLDLRHIPACTFTWPEVASVGLTEAAAREQGWWDVLVGRFPFSANGKAAAMGEREGFVKVLADRSTHRLLGVHVIGPHASTLIHEACIALSVGARLEEVERTIHAHPTLSEAFAEACLTALGRALHLPSPR